MKFEVITFIFLNNIISSISKKYSNNESYIPSRISNNINMLFGRGIFEFTENHFLKILGFYFCNMKYKNIIKMKVLEKIQKYSRVFPNERPSWWLLAMYFQNDGHSRNNEEFYYVWEIFNSKYNKYTNKEIKTYLNTEVSLRKDIDHLKIDSSKICFDDAIDMIRAIKDSFKNFTINTNSDLYLLNILQKCLEILENPIELTIKLLSFGLTNLFSITKILYNFKISSLCFINCNFLATPSLSIFELLKYNKYLKTLILIKNHLDPIDILTISHLLENNNTIILKDLHLDHNIINKDLLGIILQSLKNNKTIERLHLIDDYINFDNSKHIFNILKNGNNLKHLYLCVLYENLDSFSSIINGLEINNSLTSLYCDQSYLTFDETLSIIKAIKRNENTNIISISFYDNDNIILPIKKEQGLKFINICKKIFKKKGIVINSVWL